MSFVEEERWLVVGLKLVIFLLTVAWITFQDIKTTKDPFDKKKSKFNLRRHWWNFRWDNVVPRWIGGAIGAILASEVGYWVLKEYLDWHDAIEGSLEVTSVCVCALLGDRILNKLFSK